MYSMAKKWWHPVRNGFSLLEMLIVVSIILVILYHELDNTVADFMSCHRFAM